MFRTLRLVSAALTVLLLSTLVGTTPAQAADDTSPPVVESLVLSPTSVNTSGSAQTITATAHITDDLSGITAACCSSVHVRFASPSTGQSTAGDFTASQRTSGTPQDGMYQAPISGPLR